jgi:hypothetical protein
VAKTKVTPNEVTSNEVTSNEVTSNEVTSNEVTFNEVTSNEKTQEQEAETREPSPRPHEEASSNAPTSFYAQTKVDSKYLQPGPVRGGKTRNFFAGPEAQGGLGAPQGGGPGGLWEGPRRALKRPPGGPIGKGKAMKRVV